MYGIIKSNIDNLPIDEVNVQLYKKEDPEDLLIGVVSTNIHGQYFFADIDDGEYYLKVSKLGYYQTETSSLELSENEYTQLDISLISDPASNTGVICGIVTDNQSGLPVSGAVVALYSVSHEVETLIKLTRTSVEGKYLFGSILPGEYLVKSTLQVEE